MLKFVRTKNFKMPGNHRMVDIAVERVGSGKIVQRERWETILAVNTSDEHEPEAVPISYTKTFTAFEDKKGRLRAMYEQYDRKYGRADEPKPVDIELKETQASVSAHSTNSLPAVYESTPSKDNNYGYKKSSLSSLYRPRAPLKAAISVPNYPMESHIDIYYRAVGIMIDRYEGGEGEVVEETQLKRSVKDFVKILNEAGDQDGMTEKEVVKNTVDKFVHKVPIVKPVRLSVR